MGFFVAQTHLFPDHATREHIIQVSIYVSVLTKTTTKVAETSVAAVLAYQSRAAQSVPERLAWARRMSLAFARRATAVETNSSTDLGQLASVSARRGYPIDLVGVLRVFHSVYESDRSAVG